ncbi:MAG TPA: Rrf2 family transcriptional regulator, partial [Candidatus Limiplasma sp.]|nr:Rrf2 family transcriptional regulator [Candidatus Limiplasma sp.]
ASIRYPLFSAAKKADIVCSQKGAQGGYRLARTPETITALDVLAATDLSLFEQAGDTVKAQAPELEAALQERVFGAVETAVSATLRSLTLRQLVDDAKKRRTSQSYMFYI